MTWGEFKRKVNEEITNDAEIIMVECYFDGGELEVKYDHDLKTWEITEKFDDHLITDYI